MIATKEYISAAIAARYLDCSERQVQRYLRAGFLDGYRAPTKYAWWHIRRSSVLLFRDKRDMIRAEYKGPMLQGEQHV